MTPLTSALVSIILGIAIIAAFAFWLRRYVNRHARDAAGNAGIDTTAGLDAVGRKAAHCGDAVGD
jgi:flagellar biogenesis protein FliO